jgi:hypothetical protein
MKTNAEFSLYRSVLLRMRNVPEKNCRESQQRYFTFEQHIPVAFINSHKYNISGMYSPTQLITVSQLAVFIL